MDNINACCSFCSSNSDSCITKEEDTTAASLSPCPLASSDKTHCRSLSGSATGLLTELVNKVQLILPAASGHQFFSFSSIILVLEFNTNFLYNFYLL